MKELIKRLSERPLVHVRNYVPGMKLAYEVMKGDTYILRTNSESIQISVVRILNENVEVRVDDFESTVEPKSGSYRKGDIISISRDYLWPQTSEGYLGQACED